MAHERSIADVCLALAESAAEQELPFLTHLLNMAAIEARARQATIKQFVPQFDVKELLVGAWDWEIRNDRVYADQKVAGYFGLDPEEAARGAPLIHWTDAIHPDDRQKTSNAINRAIQTQEVFAEEYRVMTTRGLRWVFARGKCICDSNNQPLRFPGALIDITHEKAGWQQVTDAPF